MRVHLASVWRRKPKVQWRGDFAAVKLPGDVRLSASPAKTVKKWLIKVGLFDAAVCIRGGGFAGQQLHFLALLPGIKWLVSLLALPPANLTRLAQGNLSATASAFWPVVTKVPDSTVRHPQTPVLGYSSGGLTRGAVMRIGREEEGGGGGGVVPPQ
ncbi:hypothetical protein FQA47_013568 [Oryzias melastigma]|uniref:Uncharacterized protein n=1 Tax=Oryzias melastigma TaxID=30732 RepID=A0A834C4V1_ORYME|nr:hypothetical protein FQA47_013568 [Oryzias melastigma]